jgi:thioredoxin 1
MNLNQFQTRIKNARKPIVVDFWAEWCAPCKVVKPILESISKNYAKQVEFIEIDADKSQEILKHYKIMGIPTVMAVRDGEIVAKMVGAQNFTTYDRLFRSLANNEKIQKPVQSDKILRIAAGVLLALVGVFTQNWWVVAFAVLLTIWGLLGR